MEFVRNAQEFLVWSDEEMDLQNFCSDKNLPSVVIVKAGYHGANESIGADEMFYIYKQERQTRVIVKTNKGQIFSIPIDYSINFHHYQQSKSKNIPPPQLLSTIIDRWRLNTEMRWIKAENDIVLHYSVDAKSQKSGRLGILEILELFELKYALAHAMCESINCRAIALPSFFNITVSRATGAINANIGIYKNWLKRLTQLIEGFNHKSCTLCKDIIQFRKFDYTSAVEHYQYITSPTVHVPDCNGYQRLTNTCTKPTKNGLRAEIDILGNKMDNFNQFLDVPLPCLFPDRILKTTPIRPRRESSVSANHIKKPRAPTPPKDEGSEEKKENQPTFNNNNEIMTVPQFPPRPSKPLRNHSTSLRAPYSKPVPDKSSESGTRNKVEISMMKSTGNENGIHASSNQKTIQANKGVLLSEYSKLSEIPLSLDWTKVDLNGMHHLLNLFGIGHLVSPFRENQVDGNTFVNIVDEATLLEFGLDEAMAKKLIGFVRDGWRP